MVDKNGIELVEGDKVVDVHGLNGEVTDINGVSAIRFMYEGNPRYTFSSKIDSSQIEKI